MYYIFVSTIDVLLLTMCLTLVNANIPSNMTFAPSAIYGKISSGPMTYFLYKVQHIKYVDIIFKDINQIRQVRQIYNYLCIVGNGWYKFALLESMFKRYHNSLYWQLIDAGF